MQKQDHRPARDAQLQDRRGIREPLVRRVVDHHISRRAVGHGQILEPQKTGYPTSGTHVTPPDSAGLLGQLLATASITLSQPDSSGMVDTAASPPRKSRRSNFITRSCACRPEEASISGAVRTPLPGIRQQK